MELLLGCFDVLIEGNNVILIFVVQPQPMSHYLFDIVLMVFS